METVVGFYGIQLDNTLTTRSELLGSFVFK